MENARRDPNEGDEIRELTDAENKRLLELYNTSADVWILRSSGSWQKGWIRHFVEPHDARIAFVTGGRQLTKLVSKLDLLRWQDREHS